MAYSKKNRHICRNSSKGRFLITAGDCSCIINVPHSGVNVFVGHVFSAVDEYRFRTVVFIMVYVELTQFMSLSAEV